TGHTAFSGETPLIVAVKQVYETPPLPRDLDPTLPVKIERIILRCIEKDAGLRYQSLDQLREAILSPDTPPERPSAETARAVLLDRPVLRMVPPLTPPPAPRQRLSWLWVTPIAGALVIGVWILNRPDATPSAPTPT